jgi:uncharacterized membrane protein YraQ (UPF0718 family)
MQDAAEAGRLLAWLKRETNLEIFYEVFYMELKPIAEFKSCCAGPKATFTSETAAISKKIKPTEIAAFIAVLAAWWLIYQNLPDAARYLTYGLFGLPESSHLAAAVEFFIYDTPKVLMLLAIVVFGVGIVNTFFTPERTRRILAGKKEFVGNVLAALLGIATPFCSCSAIPLFIGFVTAGIPLGVTFSFLIAAPMVNEVAVVLLLGLVGWEVAAIYTGTGVAIAIVAGWVIGRLKMEKHIEGWVTEVRAGDVQFETSPQTLRDRVQAGLESVKDIVGKVWKWIVLGIGVGALIHGYVPEEFLAAIMGKSAWWSVPLAVVIGIPMYSNASGMIPVVQAFLGKGAALGTVLAFMMAVIALSLPEILILRKVLKIRLIATFVGVVGLGILLVGYLFNFII